MTPTETHGDAPPTTSLEPDDDDRLIGRVLTRREVLALMGVGSVAVVAAACAPGSVASDGIYAQSQGMTLLDVAKDGDGYTATFEIAIQTT